MIAWHRAAAVWALFSLLLVGLPLWGAALCGLSLTPFVQFPPVAKASATASFSLPVAAILGVIELVLVGAVAVYLRRFGTLNRNAPAAHFPWWGWGGLLWLAVAWLLLWTPHDWPNALLSQKFTLVWLGYILVVNAITWRRVGACALTGRPRYFATLFAGSAVVWWYFEYLNQFVHNWHYPGMENLDRTTYFLQATLPFSTVLPAVVSTAQLLDSYCLRREPQKGVAIKVGRPRLVAVFILFVASLSLMGLACWPRQLFPLIWISPFFIFVSLQVMLDRKTRLVNVVHGRWHRPAMFSLAALVCGVFWEMWNFYSFPKWVYTIPYAHGMKVFEMPLLGYAGYLPFGLECLVFADFLQRLYPGSIRGGRGRSCPGGHGR